VRKTNKNILRKKFRPGENKEGYAELVAPAYRGNLFGFESRHPSSIKNKQQKQ
jgi:hypothetical protein